MNKESFTNNGNSNRRENEATNKEMLLPNPKSETNIMVRVFGVNSAMENKQEKLTLEAIIAEDQVEGSDSIKESVE